MGNPPEITTNVLPGVAVNTNYSFTLTAKGKTPITWSGEGLPAWLKLATNGRLTGKPTAPGEYTFTVKAKNSQGEATKTLTLKAGEKPVFTAATLPGGVVGEGYEVWLESIVKGTMAPKTWSVSGKLPDWLRLEYGFLGQKLTGTPTKQGTYSITLKAENEFGSATKALKIVIGQSPSITTTSLNPAIVGTNYSATLAATGTKPITWSGENLPPGLKLAAGGQLTGKPTAEGEHTFTVTAANATGRVNTKTLTLTVGAKPAITTTVLPGGVAGAEYSAEFNASGTTPITWTKVSGTLPPGLDWLSSNSSLLYGSFRTLHGRPTKQGTYSFTLKVTNKFGSATKAFKIVIGERPAITTFSLNPAVVGTNYSATLAATGTKAITWSGANLPPGLTLAANGRLSGRPTAQGTFNFTVTAKNAIGETSQTLTLRVGEKPAITTTALPSGVAAPMAPAFYRAKLDATGTQPITWAVQGKQPDWLSLSNDGVLSLTRTPEPGTFNIAVKATNEFGSATKALKIVFYEPPIITTASLAGVVVNTNYNFTLAATGTKPITWRLHGGTLPPGVTLATNGRLSGKPTVEGTYTFTVWAENAYGGHGQELTVTVGTKPVITTTALPGGTVGRHYWSALDSTGTQPVTWTVNGKLPDWLHLSADGVLSGTPPTRGTYSFTVKATNAIGSVTKALRIVVSN